VKLLRIIIFLISLIPAIVLGNEQHDATDDYLITYLSVKDGLSQNEVTSIISDKYGFMWFGTRGGLNRYDGYEFKHFKPGQNNIGSINNPSIERLYLDKNDNIWVGTKTGGLNLYDSRMEQFHQYNDSIKDIPKRVVSIFEDNQGIKWIGGWDNGLIRYDSDKGTSYCIKGIKRSLSTIQTEDSTIWFGTGEGLKYLKKDSKYIAEKYIPISGTATEIVKDPRNPYLWIVGWDQGLIRFNYSDKTVKQYQLPIENGLTGSKSYSLMQDNKGNLWVGTWGNGLYLFNQDTERFRKLDIAPKNLNSTTIDFDAIMDIYQDNIGDIWLGTNGAGVVKLSPRSRFNTINSFHENRLGNPHVNAVHVDSNGSLWIGTKSKGLLISDNNLDFREINLLPSDRLYKNTKLLVKKIYEDKDQNIWVSFNEGLYIARKNRHGTYQLVHASVYFKSPDIPKNIRAHDFLLQEDELWIGTQHRGLYLFRRKNGVFKLVRNFTASNQPNQLQNNRITTIDYDKKGRLWFGSYQGLYLYQKSDSSFISIDNLLEGNERSICDIILCSNLDDSDNLWFGTPCSLNKISETKEGRFTLKNYTRENGMPDDYINGILNDDNGNIWFSTNAGISKLTISNGTEDILNYNQTDGLGDHSFSESACTKGKDGTLYFGGFSNLTFFKPSEIVDNKTTPQIVITDFRILNKKVTIENNGVLPVAINEVEKLKFTHKEKEFSFEFAALDYKAPLQNQYAYMLEGYDKGWNKTGSRRHVSFSNLKPGDYTLHLNGTNSNGVWNKVGRSLKIEILPAPWKTWYALLFYILCAIGFVSIIRINTIKQERLTKNLEMEKMKGDQERQINEMKLQFFTNISHEFRTPLTLIIAPINEIINRSKDYNLSDELTRKMSVINSNARRLLNMINQLIDFRKAESGKMKLKASLNSLSAFVYEIILPFKELADINHVSFKMVDKFKDKDEIWFDLNKLEMAINNLLSNAFKYGKENGKVTIYLEDDNEWVYIRVEDNGQGIPPQEKENVFSRFYQVENNKNTGSGIGLALTKRLISLHSGEIYFESVPNKQTIFTIKLPKGSSHLGAHQKDLNKEVRNIPSFLSTSKIEFTEKKKAPVKNTKNEKTVLVIEDNIEVNNYLIEFFSDYYQVISADDGSEGFKMAIETVPDLIISDVMMPNMDGFELCEKIKSKEQTNHIPVILLTAKSADQFRLLGTKVGADAYVSKPFNPDYLLEKTRQILTSREKLERKYSKKIKLGPKEIEITPHDEKIINKAIDIIERRIDDIEFDAAKFATEMGMSNSTLNRKLKALTGKSPARFIRSIKLERATQLLADPQKTIVEIAYETGFLDIKHFRTIFQNEFGQTPSQYRSENS
jgi:signal transduction histidine kinase/ligand-binding sensor domain-containing protein/DNA-binding response OmpR family regulator